MFLTTFQSINETELRICWWYGKSYYSSPPLIRPPLGYLQWESGPIRGWPLLKRSI